MASMSLCEITSGSLLKDHPEELFGGVAGVGAEKYLLKLVMPKSSPFWGHWKIYRYQIYSNLCKCKLLDITMVLCSIIKLSN